MDKIKSGIWILSVEKGKTSWSMLGGKICNKNYSKDAYKKEMKTDK